MSNNDTSIYGDEIPAVPDDLTTTSDSDLQLWRSTITRVMVSIQTQLGSAKSSVAGRYLPPDEYRDICDWQRAAKRRVGGLTMLVNRIKGEIQRRYQQRISQGKANGARVKKPMYPALLDFALSLVSWNEAPEHVKSAALRLAEVLNEVMDG